MKWIFLVVLFYNVSHAQYNITDAITAFFKKSGTTDFLFEAGSCPEIIKPLPEQPAELLLADAFKLRAKHKDCEAARYFSEVRRQWPIKPYYKLAWKEQILSYVLADDFTAAINEGNDFIDQMRGTPEVEEIHLILINSVNGMMTKAGSDRSQEWTEYALGISKRQNEESPYLKNLSFKSFLDQYPNSPNVAVINGMMTQARNNHAEYHLKIGNYYATRIAADSGMPNYPAAVMRYRIVLKWGPIVSSYTQAMYSTVDVLYKMIRAIETPNALSEDKLKEWLQIDSFRDKKQTDRKALVEQIKMQIAELEKKSDSETITQDIWIQKTKALVQQHQK